MTLYRVEFTEVSRQAVVHLPPDVKQWVKEGLRFLSKNPLVGEPLRRELEGKRKLRIGRYRILYQLDSNRRAIVIVAIGHRRDVYNRLSKQGTLSKHAPLDTVPIRSKVKS